MQVVVLQPALPKYRLPFFERVHELLGGRLSVYYSASDLGVLTGGDDLRRRWAHPLGKLHDYGPFGWQSGVSDITITSRDALVVAGNPRHISTLAAATCARACGAAVVWWAHNWSSSSRPFRNGVRRFPMKLANSLLFYTDLEVKEYRASEVGARDRRIVSALNNGLDASGINAVREVYSFRDRDNALLFIGRLTKKARLDVGIRALALLRDRRIPRPTLHVVGDGPERDSCYTLAVDLGVEADIVWYGGVTDERVIASIANRCRAFIYPGEVGLSLIHAMAYGLPAVVHNDRWRHMPEIAAFSQGRTGLTFAPEDVSGLSETVACAMNDPAALERWSAQALSVVAESFNTVDMANRFVEHIGLLRS